MSGWGLGWFGGGAAKSKEAPKKAILQLRGQLEMLNKREKHLQNQMDEQDTLARKYVSSNKNGMCPAMALRHRRSLFLFPSLPAQSIPVLLFGPWTETQGSGKNDFEHVSRP